jgi:hypothetical protein
MFGDEAPFELRLRLLSPPANDDFADAQALDGPLPISASGTNADATAEPGEPNHGGSVAAWSVWFAWTPAVSETVVIESCIADAGTSLDVYTGDSIEGLASVGVRLYRLDCAGTNPIIRLDAVAGTTYRIAVDGDGLAGAFELRIRHPSPPDNDAFASAITLESALPVTVEGSNVDATKESGEPLHAINEGGSSVWYAWTASVTGRVAIDPCDADFHTLLGVYTGDAVGSLVEVTSRLNFPLCEASIIDAVAGTTYRIAVDGVLLNLGISQGAFTLSIRTLTSPVNDDFADRITVTGPLPIVAEGTNVDATAEPGETPPGGIVGGASVWWSWTPAVSERVAIDTCNTEGSFDTTLAVYTGASLDALTPIASNDDLCQLRSLVTFEATAGTTYIIQVDGYLGATGHIALKIEGPPPNDDFIDAQVLSADLPIVVSANNARATKEPGEPDHAGNVGGHSMWYAWTPTVSQTVEVGTCLEAVDTLVAVYTGDALTELTEVANNRGGCFPGAFVLIEAVAGTTYRIAIDDYTSFLGQSYGPFTLRIAEAHPPLNDDFAGATTLTGDLTIHATGTNVDATNEPGEPIHTNTAYAGSVWFAWTPGESGEVGIDTCGSEIDTGLAVYTGSELTSLTKVASNADFSGCWFGGSLVLLTVTAGTTYHIAVEGLFRETGQILLHVREAGPPPNDDFANAEELDGALPITAAGTTLEATRQPGEPNHAGNGGIASVWYQWTSVRPQPVVVDTCSATFDTLLGVYTGGTLGALTEVASNDDSSACGDQHSLVAFDAAGGRTYHVAVDGWSSTFGRWRVGYFDLSVRSACTETVTGASFGTLKASTGIVCVYDAVVEGAVRVAPGAQLWVVNSHIVGPVTAEGAARVAVCGSSIEGPVRLVDGASVTLGDPVLGCMPNTIDGSVTVRDTTGPSVLAGNTISGKLACVGNSPAPVNGGAANLVDGPATGQCAGLAD